MEGVRMDEQGAEVGEGTMDDLCGDDPNPDMDKDKMIEKRK